MRRDVLAYEARRVEYFYVTVRDQPGEAYKLLATLERLGVDQLAFTAVPAGPTRAQLTLFPADAGQLEALAPSAGFELDGPHPAILVQGDDELGALSKVHERLFEAGVNVYASTGLSDGSGRYAYLIYVRAEDIDEAMRALH